MYAYDEHHLYAYIVMCYASVVMHRVLWQMLCKPNILRKPVLKRKKNFFHRVVDDVQVLHVLTLFVCFNNLVSSTLDN